MIKLLRFLFALMLISGVYSSAAIGQTHPVVVKDSTTEHLDFDMAKRPKKALMLTNLKIGIAGLSHDHVHNVLAQYKQGLVNIVGIAEANKDLRARYQQQYQLPDSLFYDDLKKMAIERKPDAVLGFNPVAKHIDVVEICAPLGISVMVEKPLAATLTQAKRMEFLALKYYIKLLTNYETTWYPSYQHVYNMAANDSLGTIRKIIVHDGHQGPKEIKCSKEFVSWLTDPELNGGGALIDFGCYGADLMTWLMEGQKPIAVTAVARHFKLQAYPKVEDDVSVIIEYPTATGIIEASWNWPFSIKDLEVFGDDGYMHALDSKNIVSRLGQSAATVKTADNIIPPQDNPISYLQTVLQNRLVGLTDRSSLKYNMMVMVILDAAKRSIAENRRIVL